MFNISNKQEAGGEGSVERLEESIQKSIKKTIVFENKGEMFSLEFHCENISPKFSRESMLSYLETLYADLKKAIW